MMYRIGVDLGGTNIAAGLVDENYKIVCKKSIPTGAERDGEFIVADMRGEVRRGNQSIFSSDLKEELKKWELIVLTANIVLDITTLVY